MASAVPGPLRNDIVRATVPAIQWAHASGMFAIPAASFV
jgi:hypothetical protein